MNRLKSSKLRFRYNLIYPNNTILSCFFFFFMITDLYFLILEVITQIFNSIAELVIPIGIATRDSKAIIETQPVTVKIKTSKSYASFYASYSSLFISSKR